MDSLLVKLKKAAKAGKKVKLSREEVGQAILLLSTEDVKQRFHVGNVILQQGLTGMPELIPAMGLDKPEIRRTVVYILGKLCKQSVDDGKPVPQEAVDTLYRGLLDEDPKVRCNSAIALGELKISESVENLVGALGREESAWVRPSMILALGSIGSPEVVEYLSTYQPHDSSERVAVEKVLDRSAGVKSDWRFVKKLKSAIPVEFWTVEGLENVAARDAEKQLSLAVGQVAPGRVCTAAVDVYGLFRSRTFSELLIPMAKAGFSSPWGVDEVKAVIGEKLRQENLLGRILDLHELADGQPVMRYRLEIRGKELKHSVRRAIIREITDLIATTNPTFVNSTSNYNIEIRILLEEKTAEILLKPYTIPDDRFSYRVKDVPAAINPAAAAGIVRLAPKLFPKGRVLDPFCGSGTMLIERAFAGGYSELVGVDISKSAIEAARQNASAAGLANTAFMKNDARRISESERFDEIITNMPFGIRTSKHETNVKLYEEFFDLIPRILVKNGLVILYTQEVRLTTSLFRKSKHLRLLDIHRVVSGGLRPAVFVGMRK